MTGQFGETGHPEWEWAGPWRLVPQTTIDGQDIGRWDRTKRVLRGTALEREVNWYSGVSVLYGQHDGEKFERWDGLPVWVCYPTCKRPGPHYNTDLWPFMGAALTGGSRQ